MAAQSDSSDNK